MLGGAVVVVVAREGEAVRLSNRDPDETSLMPDPAVFDV